VARYRRALAAVPGLRFQRVRDVDRSTFKDSAVLFGSAADRAAVEAALAAAGVQTKRYFRPCHTMTAFWPYANGPLPVTEDVYARVLCLPLFAALTETQIDQIAGIVAATLAPAAARG
jgi:dTDP-4-amino-4,6-dideoxygalactose transaminase